ncbi:Ferredoxin-dependent glutamate synthase [hydrothermal vent metagenome]|uniref:Ferredoxin-dependent glutamate synthase n=1 Tax=hydrothermal vent metagenome TaxID=652676 RepID=A0A3B1CBN1_9ZZZZ
MHVGVMFQFISSAILVALVLTPPAFILWLYLKNKRQTQHSLLRGKYWYIGIIRYIIESVGPEFRFYITDDDNQGQPISRVRFTAIVKAAKYLQTLISYGSKRDFNLPGAFLKNSMFPTLENELAVDNDKKLSTERYKIDKETIFFRHEHIEKVDVHPWFLKEKDIIRVGSSRENPWLLKGVVGMNGMSYGALGENAIKALSMGINMAGGSWMNTGEGGLSEYHLAGGCDIVFQIGPGLFGVGNGNREVNWKLLREKGAISNVKAFELKLAQGAKIRGGHVEGIKVTPEIAKIRGVKPWKNIDSPGRFSFIKDVACLFDFIIRIQDETGLPVGVKMVLGDTDALDDFCEEYQKRGRGPDYISVDGSEGGSGATFKEMADYLGVPILPAITIADIALRKAGLRDKVKIIAAGKLHLPEDVAVALSMGADLVGIARGFMIAIGCIMAHKCHTNECPVGVATTDKVMERALYVDEKKYRVMNYIITLRAGLFHLAAACGLNSPTELSRSNVVFKDDGYQVTNLADVFKEN